MNYEVDETIVPPVYRDLILDRTRYLVLYGGRGSGKTAFAYRKYILRCFKNEYFKCVYVRKAAAHIRDSLYAGLKATIEDLGLSYFFKCYDSDYRITAINGNCFIPKGVDDVDLTKGVEEASHLLIDEITELTEDDFNTLNALLRTSKTQVQTCVMFNPILDTHWVRKYFFHPEDPHLPNPAFGDRIKILRTTYRNNNFINRDEYYLTLLDGASGNAKRVQVDIDGDWGMSENGNPWLHAFDESKHVADVQFMPTYPVYLSFDFNRDPATCTAWQMSPNAPLNVRDSWVHCIAEFAEPVQLKELCERIKGRFPHSMFFVTGDRTGKSGNVGFETRNTNMYSLIESYLRISPGQVQCEGMNLRHNDSRQLCNAVLYNHVNFKISRTCKKLISECHMATVDEKKTEAGVLLKDRAQYKMDLFDGLRYYLQTYFEDFSTRVRAGK